MGVPKDWIEKHKYENVKGRIKVSGILHSYMKKGETVKLNEVRYGPFLPLFEAPCIH